MRLLAGLVERRAGLCRVERGIDSFDPVRHRTRLLVVDQYRIDALDAPVGHQKTLCAAEEGRRSLDRIV